MTQTSLTAAQIAALLRYGVGVGSEGGASTGLGLAGWVKNGAGQFDLNGQAINAQSIIQESGYSVGTLQTDFGQRNTGPWASGHTAFVSAFLASPQAHSLLQDDISAITDALPLSGNELKKNPEAMLDETQFNALNSFLESADGIAAAAVLDQSVINVTAPTGMNAANLVANTGGDMSAQNTAAAVAMKIYNQAGENSSLLSSFDSWLQTQADNGDGLVTSGAIRGWINKNVENSVILTGLSNTSQATSTLTELQTSTNPTIQAICRAKRYQRDRIGDDI